MDGYLGQAKKRLTDVELISHDGAIRSSLNCYNSSQ